MAATCDSRLGLDNYWLPRDDLVVTAAGLGTLVTMSQAPTASPSPVVTPAQFRARVLEGPWKISGRGMAVSVAVLEGQAAAPARLVGGGRVVGVHRPLICFGVVPDPYPVELLLQGVTIEVTPGSELVGIPA